MGGIPRPRGPQHKYRDSPSSHSVSGEIFSRRPPNSAQTVASSAVHWAVASWISCTRCFETALLEPLPCIYSYVSCICASLPSIVTVIMNTSLVQAWTWALKSASLCRTAYIASLSALACYILTGLWVRAIVCVVPLILSYCCCSSRASVSKHCMFAYSCRFVRTSNDSSIILV